MLPKDRRRDDSQFVLSKKTAGTRTTFRRRLLSPSLVPLRRGRGGERLFHGNDAVGAPRTLAHTSVAVIVRGAVLDRIGCRRTDCPAPFLGCALAAEAGPVGMGRHEPVPGPACRDWRMRRRLRGVSDPLWLARACPRNSRRQGGRHHARASRGGGGGGRGSSLIACPTPRPGHLLCCAPAYGGGSGGLCR